MLSNAVIVAGQVLTLFIMMGIGFGLRKKEKFSHQAQSQMTFILLYIVAPSIIVDSMVIERTGDMLRSIGFAAIACLIIFTICIIMVPFMFRKTEPDKRDVLRFGAMYSNAGFIGFPLIRAILGEGAMMYATVYFIMFQLVHWTHGVIIMGGKEKASLKSAVLNPGVIGFAIGMLFFLLNIRLPWPVANAVTFITALNTPLAMIVIGAIMADAGIFKLLKIPSLYIGSAIKLVIIPVLAAAALFPLRLPPIVYCTIVILSAAPSAGVTSIFAERFGRDKVIAAQFVTLSTLLSILTLPVFAAFTQKLSGL